MRNSLQPAGLEAAEPVKGSAAFVFAHDSTARGGDPAGGSSTAGPGLKKLMPGGKLLMR
jgi:hypothetical protein